MNAENQNTNANGQAGGLALAPCSASLVLADLVEDPSDNGTYRLNIDGDDLTRLWRAIEKLEADLAHWKIVAHYNQATSLPNTKSSQPGQ